MSEQCCEIQSARLATPDRSARLYGSHAVRQIEKRNAESASTCELLLCNERRINLVVPNRLVSTSIL